MICRMTEKVKISLRIIEPERGSTSAALATRKAVDLGRGLPYTGPSNSRGAWGSMRRTLFVSVAVGFVILQGCTLQSVALRSMDSVFDNAVASIMSESDLRLAEPAIAGNLKLLEGLSASDPTNIKFLLLACQGYASYALAFADDNPERASLFYARAEQYGKRALAQRGIPEKVFHAEPSAMQQALTRLGAADVPLVFWATNAWANRVYLQLEDPNAIADLPTVNAMMQWVKDREPTYFYGGPYLYFGTYFASLPPLLGGKPELAKENFERAVDASQGKFLFAYLMYAKTYAVETQDEALFQELLNRVVSSSVDVLPAQRLANAVAIKRARELLAGKDQYF
jgi:hypothetical protein